MRGQIRGKTSPKNSRQKSQGKGRVKNSREKRFSNSGKTPVPTDGTQEQISESLPPVEIIVRKGQRNKPEIGETPAERDERLDSYITEYYQNRNRSGSCL